MKLIKNIVEVFRVITTPKKKIEERNQRLLGMYEEGKYLRVNEDVDNKKLMQGKK